MDFAKSARDGCLFCDGTGAAPYLDFNLPAPWIVNDPGAKCPNCVDREEELRAAYGEGMERAEERVLAKAEVEFTLQKTATYREDSIVSNSRGNALTEVADAIASERKAVGG